MNAAVENGGILENSSELLIFIMSPVVELNNASFVVLFIAEFNVFYGVNAPTYRILCVRAGANGLTTIKI